jgi:hypothetical protein
VKIGIILMLILIEIWIGINMEIRIRIGINTMPIHNTGILRCPYFTRTKKSNMCPLVVLGRCARTRLFRLVNMQDRALHLPPPLFISLSVYGTI